MTATMPIWLKTHPRRRDVLMPLSFDAEAVWHITRLYCAGVLNDGKLRKRDLLPALSRKIPAARAGRAAAELVDEGLWVDHGDHWELVGFLDDQPSKDELESPEALNKRLRGDRLKKNRELCLMIQRRDRHLCRYCGVRVNWSDRKGKNGATYDHVDPEGDNGLDNVVVACRWCNGRKKDRTPDEAGMPLLAPGTTADLVRIQSGTWSGSGPDLVPVPDSLTHTRDSDPHQVRTGSDLDPVPDPDQIVPPSHRVGAGRRGADRGDLARAVAAGIGSSNGSSSNGDGRG